MLQPIRRIIEVSDNLGSTSDDDKFYITRDCGHVKTAPHDGFKFSICKECPPVSEHWTEFVDGRNEWICKHGIGHYDPRLCEHTVHGCCGCCNRDDFPGKDFENGN